MIYLCAPCTKKAIRNMYSTVFLGAVLVIFGILAYFMYDFLIMLVIELAGLYFLMIGIASVRSLKKGMALSEEDFKEETVGNVDIKGASYISYPFNKKE